MMIRSYIHRGNFGRLLLPLVAGWLALMATSSQAQMTLNVANFGARGDAVQFWVNTKINSVVVTTTNQLSSADIGKTIEVFGVGTQTYGQNSYGKNAYGNQDLVATITNVVNGTNIYVSQVAQATLTNTFATYGHNNQTNFANAIAAASGTNTTINIPAGKYLFLTSIHSGAYGYSGIVLRNGGVHFVGAGTNNTTLLSQGAWTLQDGYPWRGFLIEINPPIINDFPVSFEGMTLDGGVQQGNTSIHGIAANPVDGFGWDQTSDAIVVWGPGNTFTHAIWTNVMFTHWRGEMVKSLDGTTNGNLSIFNCVFTDGNATAINIYPSLNISNCVFANLFQVGEYYQAYSTNTSYFQNNFVTNITGNGFAINGGKGNNPAFVIQNNTFYFASNGQNGIMTTPGDNIFIISNQFVYPVNSHGIAIDLGAAGAQGTFENSNIVIAYNNFVQASLVVELGGGSPTDPTDPNRVEDVQVFGNSLTPTPDGSIFLQTYGWVASVNFSSNSVAANSDPGDGKNRVRFSSGGGGAQYVLVDTNNLYYSPIYNWSGVTNSISYGNGSRYEIIYGTSAGSAYALSDTDSNQIPPGAQILIQNNNTSSAPIPVYLNSAASGSPVIIPSGVMASFSWMNGAWAVSSQPVDLSPPTNLHPIGP
jgi:hypothetical protein